VLVEAGSKYETKDINGLSHFLEHMCFKGTTKRPKPIDIAGELDGLGAEYNAFTSQEFTSYFAKAKNEAFPKILEIIADLYLNPTFEAAEIEKEKGVIVEEINMYEDLPMRRVQEYLMELVYGDQPAGWGVAGDKEVIKKLKRDDFINYRSKHYLAQSTILVVAGGFNQDKVLEQINSHFSGLQKNIKGLKPKVIETQEKPKELVKFKESDQTHLVMGFRAFDIFDERKYALQVLTDILGGGMSSRLFQKVREELGAAYYVNASADLYSDHGLILMSAGVDHKQVETVIKSSLEEFARFKNEKVGAEELQRAKDHLIGRLFLSIETSDEIGYFYGGQEVMGLALETPQAAAEKINAVKAEEIQAVALSLFKNESLNLAIIGPFKDKKFSDILKVV
ncbi:MAG: pitrilysin family protein, partial [Patescibacteria group bacterium]